MVLSTKAVLARRATCSVARKLAAATWFTTLRPMLATWRRDGVCVKPRRAAESWVEIRAEE